MDQGENETGVAGQQLPQVRPALRLDLRQRERKCAAGLEESGDLFIKFLPVGDDQKRPAARLGAQDFLGEGQH